MILKSVDTNNGYLCGCCSNGIEYTEWIEESEAKSLLELYDEASIVDGDGVIAVRYEKDGKLLYGYESDIYMKRIKTYIIFGDIKNPERFLVCSEKDSSEKIYSKKEIANEYVKYFSQEG